MASDWRAWIPSTPELVTVVALAVTAAIPVALVGLSTVTGWDVARGSVLGEFWFGLGLMAFGGLFGAPYGAVLGVATLPIAVLTATGYGTPTTSEGFDGPDEHIAGAVLYSGLSTFVSGAALWTVIRLPPGPSLQRLGPAVTTTALLTGGLIVAATFTAVQVHHRHGLDDEVDDGAVAGYALHGAGVLPAPFAALLVLDWLLPVGLADAVLLSPW